jgi:hypothetical protein
MILANYARDLVCYLYAHYNIEGVSVQTLVKVDIRTGKSIPNSYF